MNNFTKAIFGILLTVIMVGSNTLAAPTYTPADLAAARNAAATAHATATTARARATAARAAINQDDYNDGKAANLAAAAAARAASDATSRATAAAATATANPNSQAARNIADTFASRAAEATTAAQTAAEAAAANPHAATAAAVDAADSAATNAELEATLADDAITTITTNLATNPNTSTPTVNASSQSCPTAAQIRNRDSAIMGCVNNATEPNRLQQCIQNINDHVAEACREQSRTTEDGWFTKFAKGLGNAVSSLFVPLVQVFVVLFTALIRILEMAIGAVYEQAYVLPEYIFDIWKQFAGIALSLVVLLGAIAAFMITSHSAKEEDARVVISNIVKVVVAIAISWTLSVVMLEQAQKLEVAIYGISTGPSATARQNGAPAENSHVYENGKINMEFFARKLNITSVGLLNPVSNTNNQQQQSALSQAFSGASNTFNAGVFAGGDFWNQGTLLVRSIIQATVLFFFVVPLVMIFFAYVVRMVAMYILIPVSALAALGLFSPKIQGKIFDPWFEKFFTVVKMPVVLAAFLVIAAIFVDNTTTFGTFASTTPADDSTIIALFGIFGNTPLEVFQRMIIFIAVIVLLIKGVEQAMSNDMTEKAVAWGKTAGGFVRDATMRASYVPLGLAKGAAAGVGAAGLGVTHFASSKLGNTTLGRNINQFGSGVADKTSVYAKKFMRNKLFKGIETGSINAKTYRMDRDNLNDINNHTSDFERYHKMSQEERDTKRGQAIRDQLLKYGEKYGLDARSIDDHATRAMYASQILPGEKTKLEQKVDTHSLLTKTMANASDVVGGAASGARTVMDDTVTGGIKSWLSDYGALASASKKVFDAIKENIHEEHEMAANELAHTMAGGLTAGSGLTGGKWRETLGISTSMPASFERKIQAKVKADVEAKLKIMLDGKSLDDRIKIYQNMGQGDPGDIYAREQKYQLMNDIISGAKFATKTQAEAMKAIFNSAVSAEDQKKQFGKTIPTHELVGKMRADNAWFSDASIDQDGFHGFTNTYNLNKVTLQSLLSAKSDFIKAIPGLITAKDKFSRALTLLLEDDSKIADKDIPNDMVDAFRNSLPAAYKTP